MVVILRFFSILIVTFITGCTNVENNANLFVDATTIAMNQRAIPTGLYEAKQAVSSSNSDVRFRLTYKELSRQPQQSRAVRNLLDAFGRRHHRVFVTIFAGPVMERSAFVDAEKAVKISTAVCHIAKQVNIKKCDIIYKPKQEQGYLLIQLRGQ